MISVSVIFVGVREYSPETFLSGNDGIKRQGINVISLWFMRQVEYPNSRAYSIFLFEIIVSHHRCAVLGTEFIIDSEPTVAAGASCHDCSSDLAVAC